jgi:hypothetical protein
VWLSFQNTGVSLNYFIFTTIDRWLALSDSQIIKLFLFGSSLLSYGWKFSNLLPRPKFYKRKWTFPYSGDLNLFAVRLSVLPCVFLFYILTVWLSDRVVCVFSMYVNLKWAPLDEQPVALGENFFFKLNIVIIPKKLRYYFLKFILTHPVNLPCWRNRSTLRKPTSFQTNTQLFYTISSIFFVHTCMTVLTCLYCRSSHGAIYWCFTSWTRMGSGLHQRSKVFKEI